MIRIVLVDDDPTVRQGLRMRLELTKAISVVGETGDGLAAVTLIRELAPDVVVMDVELPGCDGISVTQMLQAEEMPPAVVILTMHDDHEIRARAYAAGAARFVGKHQGTAELLKAIRESITHRPGYNPDSTEKEIWR
jgi:DNA-binding NarL/FixJ family response regulator